MRQIKLKNEIDILNQKNGMSEFQAFQELSENISVLENQSVDIQKNIISLRMLPFDMILRPIKRSIVMDLNSEFLRVTGHQPKDFVHLGAEPKSCQGR